MLLLQNNTLVGGNYTQSTNNRDGENKIDMKTQEV